IDTALNGNDPILLLDDAFLFYDRESKLAKMAEVRRAAMERSIAVVYAANSFNDILEFCDNAVIIDNTEVAQTGSPQDLYEHPVSTAVASLTGRCNFIEARRLSSSKTLLPEFQAI